MRFRAHDTFFIRKGWLSKGMRHVNQNESVFVSKEENPMDVLGIGSNMVKALRYWLQVVGLTTELPKGKRTQSLTSLGEIVFQHDRYVEEIGTLQLLHYRLASQAEEATAWYCFFNEFNMTEFEQEDFISMLQTYIKQNDSEPFSNKESKKKDTALRSLNEDFACIINTYVPRYKTNPEKVSAENNIDCPLGELGLIDILGKKERKYRKSIPSVSSFNPWIILAIIIDQAEGKKTISLNELLTAKCNIGKIFNLDAISMMDILHKVERIGEIKIIRTAGLDIIKILNDRTFKECVENYYKTIENQG